jgi:hypothetical protein
MTPEHIALVHHACAEVLLMADTTAVRFYARLFVPDPPLRSLFHGDMREQGRQRMATLQEVVARLSGLEEPVPLVQQPDVRLQADWESGGNLVLQL